MGTRLVIVESPSKAKTINRILGKDYIVKSSVGHVRDLPVKNLGVDIQNNFRPRYVSVKGKKKVIEELRKAAGSADLVYLAPDPDREGEAIAWHLKELLKKDVFPDRFVRVQYNEVTPRAVREAFENPGELDMDRVNAQQARRILDRIVGYKVSPLLWTQIRGGLSAGRVQSVALRLVCERELEVTGFKPEAYWILGARVRKLLAPLEPFVVRLVEINGKKADVRSEDDAKRICTALTSRALRVQDVETRMLPRRPPPPFITSSLQQAASGRFGLSPSRTMSIAQKLYEGIELGQGPEGLITYMRTDSFSVSREALAACRSYINSRIGAEYCPEEPNVYRSRASAQEAHEAIRPTDVNRTPDSLKGRLDAPGLKLYKLIWERFVASQMTPARIERRTATVESVLTDATAAPDGKPDTYLFRATTSKVVFPGFMKVAGVPGENAGAETDDDDSASDLPPLSAGEPLHCVEWLSDRKETKPPPRYSEAALVKALEQNGVGRPSTYASIVGTLSQRQYVTREKRTLIPTELGMSVSALLVDKLGELFDVKFTAAMEEALDAVEKGDIGWTAMLREFYERFEQWLEAAKPPPADRDSVARLLTALEQVREWRPAVTRGKRTYSDEKFVTSVRSQFDTGAKGISQRQLAALARIAGFYREQVEGTEELLGDLGLQDVLQAPEAQPPRDTTREKLVLLQQVELDQAAGEFVASLRQRVEGGRRLSDAQLGALDRVVVGHAAVIPGFEERREALALPDVKAMATPEVGPLLDALTHVSEWKPPVKRGKRTFDDAAFYASLCDHFAKKTFLSIRQIGALRRLVRRYGEQIPDVDKLDLGPPPDRRERDAQEQP